MTYKQLIFFFVLLFILCIISIGIVFWIFKKDRQNNLSDNPEIIS